MGNECQLGVRPKTPTWTRSVMRRHDCTPHCRVPWKKSAQSRETRFGNVRCNFSKKAKKRCSHPQEEWGYTYHQTSHPGAQQGGSRHNAHAGGTTTRASRRLHQPHRLPRQTAIWTKKQASSYSEQLKRRQSNLEWHLQASTLGRRGRSSMLPNPGPALSQKRGFSVPRRAAGPRDCALGRAPGACDRHAPSLILPINE